MPFHAGVYQPPVPENRTQSPEPEAQYDPSQIPFTGLELMVRHLRRDSRCSAKTHLEEILAGLQSKGECFPPLQIVSPSPTENLDYVYVSLVGPLREQPRPDILEQVRKVLEGVDGIEARWKMLKGLDKTRQLYFVPTDRSQLKKVKDSLDKIFQSHRYELQGSWSSESTGRITYNFVHDSTITAILRKNPVVDERTLEPARPRYIPVTYGLEVALVGVADIPCARKEIDDYLQRKYASMVDGPVVCWSRMEFMHSVYCAVLRTPEITKRFLNDPFELFADAPFASFKPDYLYNVNTRGVSFASRPNAAQADSPFLRNQLDNLASQVNAITTTLDKIMREHATLIQTFNQNQSAMIQQISNVLLLTQAESQLRSAEAKLSTLQASADSATLLLALTPTEEGRHAVETHLQAVNGRIASAETNINRMSTGLVALQSRLLPVVPAANTFVSNVAHSNVTVSPDNSPTSTSTVPSKRSRVEDRTEGREVQMSVEAACGMGDRAGATEAVNALMEIDDHGGQPSQ